MTRDWGDGTYTFRLEFSHWFELQEKCGCGPLELFERLCTRRWRVSDVSEVIRLGLIGGGKSAVEALKLVRVYVQDRPLLESVGVALSIVGASLSGPSEDQQPGEAGTATEPIAGSSPSPSSTETVQ